MPVIVDDAAARNSAPATLAELNARIAASRPPAPG
jgi:hypothetical protein